MRRLQMKSTPTTGGTVNWQWFAGGTILTVGLLLKVGAPVESVAVGVLLAAFWNWRGSRLARRQLR